MEGLFGMYFPLFPTDPAVTVVPHYVLPSTANVGEYSKACVQQLPLPHWKKINQSKLPCGVTAPGGLS